MTIGQYLSYNLSSLLLFSGALALSDYVRGKIMTGFPWNLWSYSLSWFNESLQMLNIFGLYSFNLIVITLFTIPAILFLRKSLRIKILVITFSSLIIVSNYIYGTYLINKNNAYVNYLQKKDKVLFKVISPNFELKYDSSINEMEQKLEKLIKYSEPDQEKKTFFIWPEGVFTGFSFDEISKFDFMFNKNFKKNHFIIFGINTIDSNTGKYFNSLVIVNNEFKILKQYNKRKLVPFGEFLPFDNFFKKIGIKKITQGFGSFSSGKNQNNILIENINILPLICYEIIFPELIQLANSSNLIVNISEDGWFGNTIGPHQHFAKAIFRSIENDTYLVRSANKGVSAIINNKGEIQKKLNIGEAGNIEAYIPLFKTNLRNKNDLIFFILLFTYLSIFIIFKNKNNAK